MNELNEQEILQKLQELNGWSYEDNALVKQFAFKNFKVAMAKMIEISYVAEALNHHPNWSNVYNRLIIKLNTHDAGGVTEKDFELAKRIEKLEL